MDTDSHKTNRVSICIAPYKMHRCN